MAIAVSGLRHRYATTTGDLVVLDGVDVHLPAGDYLSLTGSSGAGKSTLLAVLGGLERPQEGEARVGEHDLLALDADGLAGYRRSTIGFVFQHFGLLEALTAAENIELALTLAGGIPARRRSARAHELLGDLGLAERAGHRPLQLSGGERQRVSIARALANDPALVLADEPTGNLDEDSAARVIEVLETAASERGCTLVVVTHNRALARRARHHLHLQGGRVGVDPQFSASPPTR